MFTSDLANFLTDAGIDAAFGFHGHLPDAPDEAVVLTPRSGLSESFEGAFERPAITITCRGPQNDPHGAEVLAQAVDRALVPIGPRSEPMAVGALYVTNVQRLGGPPALFDFDSSRRSLMAATYVFEVATA